jgi:hypothetical protein
MIKTATNLILERQKKFDLKEEDHFCKHDKIRKIFIQSRINFSFDDSFCLNSPSIHNKKEHFYVLVNEHNSRLIWTLQYVRAKIRPINFSLIHLKG